MSGLGCRSRGMGMGLSQDHNYLFAPSLSNLILLEVQSLLLFLAFSFVVYLLLVSVFGDQIILASERKGGTH
jgi:hypothetical protein